MARRLVARNLTPDLILVSPAERAWSSAQILAQICEIEDRCVIGVRELYLAAPDTVWRILAQRGGNAPHMLVCGHNPGLSELAARFGPHREARELPTAGMASAVWEHGSWLALEPETAQRCELDDPQNLNADWLPPV